MFVSLRTPALQVVLTALALLPACTQPAQRADLQSDVPAERTLGVASAAAHPDIHNAHELVDLLDSSDPALRMLAAGALRDLSGGETFGYRQSDPASLRAPAIQRWRAWADEVDPDHAGAPAPSSRVPA